MIAKNIMRETQTLTTDMSLVEASASFTALGVDFAPVRNAGGGSLGVLSAKALFKALMVAKVDPPRDKIAHHLELLTEIVFINEEEKLPRIMKALLASPSDVVFVSTAAKKIGGFISYSDLYFIFRGQDQKPADLLAQVRQLQTERDRLANEISTARASEKVYRDIFERSPYMVHAADAEGRIVLANPMIHTILGYPNGQLINRSVFDIYPQNIHSQITSGLKRLQATGRHDLVHSSMVKKSGELVRINLVSSTVLDANGNFLHTLTISRTENIDEMKAS